MTKTSPASKIYSEQDSFWKGSFGDNYIERNRSKKLVKNNYYFFKKIFYKNKLEIKSMIEIGPNIGLNIKAIKKICKLEHVTGIEINQKACFKLKNIKNVEVINESILNFSTKKLYDLVLCKAILIHIDPKKIQRVFQSIYNVTKRGSHVLFAEYYSKDLKKIVYRNNINKLFKDDFASKFLEKYSNFMLIDYGFCYHKDKYPQDDLTWFLMKRK